MANADLIVPAFIDQKILLEGRLGVAALHTGGEAAVCGFDVAIAMVNTNNVNSVHCFHVHSSSLFCFKICVYRSFSMGSTAF